MEVNSGGLNQYRVESISTKALLLDVRNSGSKFELQIFYTVISICDILSREMHQHPWFSPCRSRKFLLMMDE